MSAKSEAVAKKQKQYQTDTQRAAMMTLNKLVSQFYEVFMDNDPEHDLVAQKRKQIVAKWKMYCHQKNLVLEVALPMADEACKSIVDKYNEQMKDFVPSAADSFQKAGRSWQKLIASIYEALYIPQIVVWINKKIA